MAVTRDIYEADDEGDIMTRDGKRYKQRRERKMLTVHIEKGMRDGQKITFPGDGDVLPGHQAGDVVFVIKQIQHDKFQRKGGDLVMKHEVSLYEALTGVDFVLEHLDGHKVRITSTPGEVLSDETVKQVTDEGMPIFGHDAYMKGVLFVQLDVKMPEKLDLTEAQKRALGMLLGATKPGTAGTKSAATATGAAAASADEAAASDADEAAFVETKVMEEPDMESRKARENLANEAEGSDSDEGGMGGQRVQCASH
jgi:DnaJ family protein A protein 2